MVVRDANAARRELAGVEQISKTAKEKADEIEGALKKAQEGLAQLSEITDVGALVTKASNDDRQAFNKLVDFVQKKDPRFREIALRAVENIIQDVDPLVLLRLDPQFQWDKAGVDPSKADFAKYREVYQTSPRSYRLSILGTLWAQERFPKRQRLEFLAEVIRTDSSLRALHRACVLMNNEAHIDKNILGVGEYLQWWEANKQNY